MPEVIILQDGRTYNGYTIHSLIITVHVNYASCWAQPEYLCFIHEVTPPKHKICSHLMFKTNYPLKPTLSHVYIVQIWVQVQLKLVKASNNKHFIV